MLRKTLALSLAFVVFANSSLSAFAEGEIYFSTDHYRTFIKLK